MSTPTPPARLRPIRPNERGERQYQALCSRPACPWTLCYIVESRDVPGVWSTARSWRQSRIRHPERRVVEGQFPYLPCTMICDGCGFRSRITPPEAVP